MLENLSPLKIYSKEAAEKLAKALSKVSLKDVKGSGTFEVIATTEGIDRDGEKILVSGWTFDNYMKNPIMLWGHNYYELDAIIGAVTNLKIVDSQVVVSGVFANTPSGQLAKQLYDDGILKAVSVGFIPLDRTGNTITKAELLEISFVSVPSNPDALSLSKFMKLDNMIKTAVAPHETSLAPEEAVWDEAAAVANLDTWAEGETSDEGEPEDSPEDTAKIDFAKYQQGFAWFDEAAADQTSSYKLPHHDIIEGELITVFLGVEAAMNALIADGAGIPEDQQQAVYEHLANHYEQFGKTAPEMSQNNPTEEERSSEDEKAVNKEVAKLKRLNSDLALIIAQHGMKKFEPTEKAGRVLSSKNRTLIQSCADSMNESVKLLTELLAATEPEKGSVIELAKGVKIEAAQLQKMVESVIKSAKLLESNI